jgi:hypothetical protein
MVVDGAVKQIQARSLTFLRKYEALPASRAKADSGAPRRANS